jgi:hypothetical protein
MARVTHVGAARQRYVMVPDIDPATGEQRTTTSKRRRPTRDGRAEVTVRATVPDKSRPLPPETCDHCGGPIPVGAPYKWIKPKSGPYGGHRRTRHAACPTWQVWEYSNSLSARAAQIQHSAGSIIDGIEDEDSATSAAEEIAGMITELAQEKQESADSIESGFGHETSVSQELAGVASELESWASDVEGVSLDDWPEGEEVDCETCGGTGEDEAETGEDGDPAECADCGGTGTVTADEPSEDAVREWIDAAQQALLNAVEGCPV